MLDLLLEQLQTEGAINAPPVITRPVASGRARVRPRGSVSDVVTEERERRR